MHFPLHSTCSCPYEEPSYQILIADQIGYTPVRGRGEGREEGREGGERGRGRRDKHETANIAKAVHSHTYKWHVNNY